LREIFCHSESGGCLRKFPIFAARVDIEVELYETAFPTPPLHLLFSCALGFLDKRAPDAGVREETLELAHEAARALKPV
jgi:hypothetical protein